MTAKYPPNASCVSTKDMTENFFQCIKNGCIITFERI